jgi:hypothetical protein
LKSFSKQIFANGAITRGVQGKEYGFGGIMKLHLEELHTKICYEFIYLITMR